MPEAPLRPASRRGADMATTREHALKHIRLQLARSKEFPAGSPRHGYDVVAPLDSNGHIDLELWRKHRDACRGAGSGTMKTMPSGISSTGLEARNTPVGRSNTAPPLPRTTKQASAWERIVSRPANMYRSRIMAASFTPSS
jgi:hypothetical protein